MKPKTSKLGRPKLGRPKLGRPKLGRPKLGRPKLGRPKLMRGGLFQPSDGRTSPNLKDQFVPSLILLPVEKYGDYLRHFTDDLLASDVMVYPYKDAEYPHKDVLGMYIKYVGHIHRTFTGRNKQISDYVMLLAVFVDDIVKNLMSNKIEKPVVFNPNQRLPRSEKLTHYFISNLLTTNDPKKFLIEFINTLTYYYDKHGALWHGDINDAITKFFNGITNGNYSVIDVKKLIPEIIFEFYSLFQLVVKTYNKYNREGQVHNYRGKVYTEK